MATTPPTTHTELIEWVTQVADLTQPKDIYWCTGTTAEWDQITSALVDAAAPTNTGGRLFASPLARRLAKELSLIHI